MKGWSLRRSAGIGAIATALAISACGGGKRQDADEPSGSFPVDVSSATFPTSQTLSQHADLTITVRNTGSKAIPNLAVTILNPKNGTAAQAFSQNITASRGADLASRSRAVWIIDTPPGHCGYSCKTGGPGSEVTAYSNTWALGRTLAPHQAVTFRWGVTAVQAGHYTVEYQVAAGLNGKAQAVDSSGKQPTGSFHVTVATAPRQQALNNAGQPVSTG